MRHRCSCLVLLCIKEYPDRYVLMASGGHERDSLRISTGILCVKQRSAVVNAVKSCPMTTGNAVHSNLWNFSTDKRVPCDVKSMKAVNRLVSKTRVNIMGDRVDGADIDGSEGSMNQLDETLSLLQFIEWHNDSFVFFSPRRAPSCVMWTSV